MTIPRFEPTPPTHNLTSYNPDTKERGQPGVAWYNEETGRVLIKLNPGTVLSYTEQASGIVYALFKRDVDGKSVTGRGRVSNQPSGGNPGYSRSNVGDDDIPF